MSIAPVTSSQSSLQRENSMLTWEGEQIMGQTAIIAKLNVSGFEVSSGA